MHIGPFAFCVVCCAWKCVLCVEVWKRTEGPSFTRPARAPSYPQEHMDGMLRQAARETLRRSPGNSPTQSPGGSPQSYGDPTNEQSDTQRRSLDFWAAMQNQAPTPSPPPKRTSLSYQEEHAAQLRRSPPSAWAVDMRSPPPKVPPTRHPVFDTPCFTHSAPPLLCCIVVAPG